MPAVPTFSVVAVWIPTWSSGLRGAGACTEQQIVGRWIYIDVSGDESRAERTPARSGRSCEMDACAEQQIVGRGIYIGVSGDGSRVERIPARSGISCEMDACAEQQIVVQ